MVLRPILRALWRPVRALLLLLAATILAFEEWGWRPLVAWAARIARWPPLAALERRLQASTPIVAVLSFLAPAVLLFPVKLLALWLIHLGHVVAGVVVIVAAKLLGTAVVGRIFVLTEPQLMQLPWFARAIGWWRDTKARLRLVVAASPTWRLTRLSARRWRQELRQWWRAHT